jgi:hypothetical protein
VEFSVARQEQFRSNTTHSLFKTGLVTICNSTDSYHQVEGQRRNMDVPAAANALGTLGAVRIAHPLREIPQLTS